MLFRSFVALSLISLASASPAPPTFGEDCDCTTKIVTTTVQGSPTVVTSVVPTVTSVLSSIESSATSVIGSVASSATSAIGSVASSILSYPTAPPVTVTITETAPWTHHHHSTGGPGDEPTTTEGPSAPTAEPTSSDSDCDGTTEYTTVTVGGSPTTGVPTVEPTEPPTEASSSSPAAATPSSSSSGSTSQCGTAPVQCCNSVAPAKSDQGRHMLAMVDRAHEADSFGDTLVGGGCSTGIGLLNSGTCGGTPVCCTAGSGLISIGCIPIIL